MYVRTARAYSKYIAQTRALLHNLSAPGPALRHVSYMYLYSKCVILMIMHKAEKPASV